LIFFFQAEDGIRDFHVTGVQTCALPISVRRVNAETWIVFAINSTAASAAINATMNVPLRPALSTSRNRSRNLFWSLTWSTPSLQIGRASCREIEVEEQLP